MSRTGRVSAVVAAVMLCSVGTGGAVAASRTGDEAALQVQRPGGDHGDRGPGGEPAAADDPAGEARSADVALRRPDEGSPGGGAQARRRRVLGDRSGPDQQVPARRRRATRGCTSRSCSRSTRSTGSGRCSRRRSPRRRRSTRPSRTPTTRSAPSSRPRSASSRSTRRWSTSRTSRAGGGSSRPRARTRT